MVEKLIGVRTVLRDGWGVNVPAGYWQDPGHYDGEPFCIRRDQNGCMVAVGPISTASLGTRNAECPAPTVPLRYAKGGRDNANPGR